MSQFTFAQNTIYNENELLKHPVGKALPNWSTVIMIYDISLCNQRYIKFFCFLSSVNNVIKQFFRVLSKKIFKNSYNMK